jgi:hypothetical protein
MVSYTSLVIFMIAVIANPHCKWRHMAPHGGFGESFYYLFSCRIPSYKRMEAFTAIFLAGILGASFKGGAFSDSYSF